MALEVKRKRVEVDLILDQEKAERISQLGEQLARAAASHVTEGANAAAKRIAKQIDELREEVSGQIVHLTLEALPLSQWRQVLEANTTTTKDGRAAQRLEDITADALRLMIRKSVPETPVEDIAAIIPELSDGQLSAIRLKPVAVYLDGHTSDVDASMASRTTAVATLDGQTLTWVSNATTLLAALKSDGYQPAEVTIKAGGTTVTKHVYLQADQPDGVVGDLWVRTEKLHNGLRYYTGAYGTAAADANSMFFLVDRPREIWRKTIDGWTLLTGKELE